jgi:hypothetical protein
LATCATGGGGAGGKAFAAGAGVSGADALTGGKAPRGGALEAAFWFERLQPATPRLIAALSARTDTVVLRRGNGMIGLQISRF